MSDKEEAGNLEHNELDAEQVCEVTGGSDGCSPSVEVGTGGITFSGSPESIGGTVIRTYEGLIEATSYAIERIANSLR